MKVALGFVVWLSDACGRRELRAEGDGKSMCIRCVVGTIACLIPTSDRQVARRGAH